MRTLQLDSPSPENSNDRNLSYFKIPGSLPLLRWTIGQLLDDAVQKNPNKECLIVPFQNIRKTYIQIKREVDSLANGLLALGLKRGDRIGLWSPNTYESYISSLAAWKAGLILVSINAAYKSRELLFALKKVDIRCLIISRPFRKQNFYDILLECVPELETSEPGHLKCKQTPHLEFVVSVQPGLRGTLSITEIATFGTKVTPAFETQHCDDICSIFYTSGTTGSPKGVQLSHFNLVNNGYFVGKRLGLDSMEKICLPVPLFHVYGCQIGILACISAGSTVVLPSYGYDAKSIFTVVSEEKCTTIAGTPTMFSDLLQMMDFINGQVLNLSSLKKAITGGAVCSSQLVSQLKNKSGIQHVFSNYGMTELGAVYLSLAEDLDSLIYNAVGFPGDHIEVKLVNKMGQIVPLGSEGELCVRGYNVMEGYWGDAEATLQVLEPSGWFHTGDLFIMMKSGHGQIIGRIKEMINRGGENVYPREVEDLLKLHESILDAQVFGVPDSRMGEEPAVWIKLKKDAPQISADDVKEFCKSQISHFKVPKYILFRQEFPQTPLGKVQKFRMRDETIKELQLYMK